MKSMNTITPLSSATQLGSSTARSSGQSPGQRYFQPGEILKATILEARGNDIFTLDIAGTHIAAQSKAQLLPGQVLQLQVSALSPQVELKIVSNSPQQFFGRSLTLIGKNINLTDLAKTLQQTGSPREGLSKATVLEAKGNDVFILDIGGKQIAAQSKATLSTGQTLQLQEAATTPQLMMRIAADTQQPSVGASVTLIGSPTEITDLRASLQPPGTSAPVTPTEATVLETKGNDVFILDIGGKLIAAQSKAQLFPGQTLKLQEAATTPQLVMKIAAGVEQQSVGASLSLIGDPTGFTDPATLPQQYGSPLLDGLSPSSRATLENFFSVQQNTLTAKDGGEVLKHLVDRMGLSLESLLAAGDKEHAVTTLKAALLETAHVFKDASDITKTAHQLLGTIEIYQLAQLHMENAANFIFPLPLPFLEKGYLLVEDYGRQKQGDGTGPAPPMRFSLHLTLAGLGNLRVDFLQYQDGLYIRFNTDSKEKSDFVESFSTDLKQAISTISVLGLSFSENATDPAAELIKKILPQGSSILDTTA